MELLIRGARLVDAFSDFIGDVYIRDGRIEEIGENIIKQCEMVEGEGLVLLPSFIDLHAHFRDPGFTNKEDLLSGSRAAVKGGYTYVNLMANTKPVCSSMGIVNYVKKRISEIGILETHQTVSITLNMEGKDLGHLDTLDRNVRFISDDGKGVLSNEVMLLAMQKAQSMGMGVISHAEFEELNKYDTRLSENLMTMRDIELSKYTGCHLHMAHVSTAEAMERIIEAKKNGVHVTCEVTPHHIALMDNDYRVNPPIRREEDVTSLIAAIRDGWVDAIGTDHAPHTKEDKLKGSPGLSGIETAFSVCYSKLVKENGISLNKLSEVMSAGPGRILGLNKGQIKVGYDGDLVLVDLYVMYRVNSETFESKGKNTPFDGMELYGVVEKTLKGGRLVYDRRTKNDNR